MRPGIANFLNCLACLLFGVFLKWANPGLFLFISRSFQTQFYRKTLGFSGIRTWIVGVEGEHADHLTTTTAHLGKASDQSTSNDFKILAGLGRLVRFSQRSGTTHFGQILPLSFYLILGFHFHGRSVNRDTEISLSNHSTSHGMAHQTFNLKTKQRRAVFF